MPYQVSPQFKITELYGEWSLMDTKQGLYYELNESGKIILESLLQSQTDQGALLFAAQQLQIEAVELKSHFESFKYTLIEKGIIKRE
jgi:Coenzyme PQQ synthesis protein D (PqqD)